MSCPFRESSHTQRDTTTRIGYNIAENLLVMCRRARDSETVDDVPDSVSSDFDVFYEQCFGRIVQATRSLAGDGAEDIAQEAFAIAFIRWFEVRNFDAPYAWVQIVARRLAMRRRSRDQARPHHERAAFTMHDPAVSEFALDLTTALASLPVRHARAFARHHLDDLPISTVASELECSEGAAKVLIHRGRRRLVENVGGYSGCWVSTASWSTDAIVEHLRSTGSAAHVGVIVEQHLANRGGRWLFELGDGRYEISRDDGLRLDHGAFIIDRGHLLTLMPHSTRGTVTLQASVNGNLLSASQFSNTTPPTDGVPDYVWMNLLLEASQFEWGGRTRAARSRTQPPRQPPRAVPRPREATTPTRSRPQSELP